MDLYLGHIMSPNHLIALSITLIIKFIIMIYIYNDSKSKEMITSFWILLILLIPSYIGLIIYLIFRKRNEYTSCPNCHFKIKRKTTICPKCNQVLIHKCPRCNQIIKEEWEICPYCTEILKRDS